MAEHVHVHGLGLGDLHLVGVVVGVYDHLDPAISSFPAPILSPSSVTVESNASPKIPEKFVISPFPPPTVLYLWALSVM